MSAKYLEESQLEIKKTLESSGLFEVKAMASKNNEVRVLGRVQNEDRWLKLTYLFLRDDRTKQWNTSICKKFFVDDKDKYVYAWVVTFEINNIDNVKEIRALFLKSMEELTSGKIISKEDEDKFDKDMDGALVKLPWENRYKTAVKRRVGYKE